MMELVDIEIQILEQKELVQQLANLSLLIRVGEEHNLILRQMQVLQFMEI